MTASLDPFGSMVASPDSKTAMEVDVTSTSRDQSLQDRQILAYLQQSWNRLDLSEWEPVFQGTAMRKLYLHDVASVRHGRRVYYSLGAGPQRQAFGEAFDSLSSRRLQQLFLQCATLCLQENRFMSQADFMLILHEGRGKRFQGQDANTNVVSTGTYTTSPQGTIDNSMKLQNRHKRQRTSVDSMQCFT
ncbi:hypothetical protein MHU86_626 [Fragilaria crotonensis]|nr:hypothetical protein MHU86_626 [Fragilaria crotonensis]